MVDGAHGKTQGVEGDVSRCGGEVPDGARATSQRDPGVKETHRPTGVASRRVERRETHVNGTQ
jgi:hypothetical protein